MRPPHLLIVGPCIASAPVARASPMSVIGTPSGAPTSLVPWRDSYAFGLDGIDLVLIAIVAAITLVLATAVAVVIAA
jgi:hypothetical protein